MALDDLSSDGAVASDAGRVRWIGIYIAAVAVLLAIYNGRTPREILAVDIKNAIARLGFAQHLSPNRANGLFSMVERIRALAASEAAGAASPGST